MNVARLPQLRSSEGAGCDRFLAQMLAAHPPNLNFGLAKPNGDVSCSAVTRRSAVNIADRAYFEKALQTRRFAIGDHQVDRITRLPSISYAYPVQDAGGEVLAVVRAAQSLNWLTAALANVGFPAGAALVATDRNGAVLGRMPDGGNSSGTTLPDDQVRAYLSGRRAR